MPTLSIRREGNTGGRDIASTHWTCEVKDVRAIGMANVLFAAVKGQVSSKRASQWKDVVTPVLNVRNYY